MRQLRLKKLIAMVLACVFLAGSFAYAEDQGVPQEAIPTETVEPTQTPVADPTQLPTEAPTETPAPTAVPTQAPTAVPTAVPTQAPTATVKPTIAPAKIQTAPIWDETICDHANANCEKAPKCTNAGCSHISTNKIGLPMPDCVLGAWLLDKQDALGSSGNLLKAAARATSLDLNVDDAPFYRSGNYRLTGGEKRAKATVTIKAGRTVSLTLDKTTIKNLVLEAGANVIIDTMELNQLEKLVINDDCILTLRGSGAFNIVSASQPASSKASVSVQSGCVKCADLKDTTGRKAISFPAKGMNALTVEGASYPAIPLGGDFYLYLPTAAEGTQWASAVVNNVLNVGQITMAPQNNSINGTIPIDAAGDYTIVGAATITVNRSGVKLYITGGLSGDVSIDGQPCRLTITGQNSGTLTSTKDLTISGTGSMKAGTVEGYENIQVSGLTLDHTLWVDGVQMPLLLTSDGLLLPSKADHQYVVKTDGKQVLATAVQNSVHILDKNISISSKGSYTFLGQSGQTAFEVSVDKDSTLTFQGECVLSSLTANNATVLTQSGRLDIKNAPSGIASYRGNIRIANNSQNVTLVKVTDEKNAAVANTPVTVRLNDGTVLQTTTFEDGTLHLRGFGTISQKDIAITDGETVYTAVLVDDNATANPGYDITNISASQPGANKLGIAFDVKSDAKTVGIIYKIGDVPLADCYDAKASIVTGKNAPLTIAGLDQGETITYRVFASQNANAKLNASTQDGFSFSERRTITLLDIDLSKQETVYNGEAYELPFALPKGVQLSYQGGATPKDVGSYTVIITVPDGHAIYAAASFSIPLTIGKASGTKALQVTGELETVYDGDPIGVPEYKTLAAGEIIVSFFRVTSSGNEKLTKPPKDAGKYKIVYHIPGDENVKSSTVEVDYVIKKRPITILPKPNQWKFVGQEDPEDYPFTFTGLIKGDTLEGYLTRKGGETVGEYPFLTDMFSAGKNYTIEISPKATQFVILSSSYDPPPIGPSGTYEKIIPIHQTIFLDDGRRLDVVLNTTDSLTFSYMKIGQIMLESRSMQARPMSPSMRLNEKTQQVALILRAEAELTKEGGYDTDDDGHLKYTGRTLRLSYNTINILARKGISHVGLQLREAAMLVDLKDLLNRDVEASLKQQKSSLKDAIFYLTIEPISTPDQALADKMMSTRCITDAYRMAVTVVIDNKSYDISTLLPSLSIHFSVEDAFKMLTDIAQFNEETYETDYTLAKLDGEQGLLLKTAFIAPYMPGEEAMPFACLMATQRYLTVHEASGIYAMCLNADR